MSLSPQEIAVLHDFQAARRTVARRRDIISEGRKALGLANEVSYHLPLTQELIGDALSLSLPRVNHALRQLRESSLVVIERRHVTIKNPEELAALSDFKRTYLADVAWPDWRQSAHRPRRL